MGVERVWRARMAEFLYPSDPAVLRETLARLAGPSRRRQRALGVVVPHSSLEWSGAVTGAVLGEIEVPRRCIVLGPNHTGYGAGWSVLSRGAMQTPLGEVAIDEPLAQIVQGLCPLLDGDETAHVGEHAIEAVLPWLRWAGGPELRVVPIVTRSDAFEEARQVADALAKAIRQVEEPVLIVASAEWSQFRPAEEVRAADAQLLAALDAVDAGAFERAVAASRASMCGATVIACAAEAVRRLGAASVRTVRYATSAESGGDPHSATGYAGMIFQSGSVA